MKQTLTRLFFSIFGRFLPLPPHDLYCPRCHYDGAGDFFEVGYVVEVAGKDPNTVHGYGEYWAEGIQTCPRCNYSFPLHN